MFCYKCSTELGSDVDYFPPYPTVYDGVSTHVTYLDTIGRPAVSLRYLHLTDMHSGTIYVGAATKREVHFLTCRLTGLLQGAALGALEEARCCRDCVLWPLRPRSRVETCRDAYPEEVECSANLILLYQNMGNARA